MSWSGFMGKIIFYTVIVFLGMAVAPINVYSEVSVLPSKNKTSADVPLNFELERTEWSSGVQQLQVWGTIRNNSKKKFDSVTVVISAYDSAGKFLGRETKYAAPLLIKPGQVSYINGYMNTAKQMPSRLEYSVSSGE